MAVRGGTNILRVFVCDTRPYCLAYTAPFSSCRSPFSVVADARTRPSPPPPSSPSPVRSLLVDIRGQKSDRPAAVVVTKNLSTCRGRRPRSRCRFFFFFNFVAKSLLFVVVVVVDDGYH